MKSQYSFHPTFLLKWLLLKLRLLKLINYEAITLFFFLSLILYTYTSFALFGVPVHQTLLNYIFLLCFVLGAIAYSLLFNEYLYDGQRQFFG